MLAQSERKEGARFFQLVKAPPMGKRQRSWEIMKSLGKAQKRHIRDMDEELPDPYSTGSRLTQMKPEDSMGIFATYSEADAMLNRKARAKKGSTWRLRRTACCNCGVQYSPQWRSGPSGPRTLCNACGVRYAKGQPPFGVAPSARELGMPAEPMEGQLSAGATAGDSSAAMVSVVRDPDHMPASYSPNLPELDIHFDSSDEDEAAMRGSRGPATGVRQCDDAHEGTTAQPEAGLAHLQMGSAQGLTQPAFRAAPTENAWAAWDQQPTAGSALTPFQGQTVALRPAVRMLGLLSMLAARLMPAGMLQYSKVEALVVGIVYSITASRTALLHNILRRGMIDSEELKHRAWLLAVRAATEQWAPESSGHASGHLQLREPLPHSQEPSPPAVAEPLVGMGSPIFQQVPKRKRTRFVEAGTTVSPSSSIQARNDSEQGIHHQQAAAVPTASVRIDAAQEPGILGHPGAVEVNAVQQASAQTAWETQAAAAEAKQQADVLHHVGPADHIRPVPQPAQAHRHTPMRAVSTRVQDTQAGSTALPEAPPASFVLPPPEKEFLLLQRTLMPEYEAESAGAPGMQPDEGICTDEDEEEIDIMAVSPWADQPLPQDKPDQALQRAQPQQRSRPAEQPPPQHAGTEEEIDTMTISTQAQHLRPWQVAGPAQLEPKGVQTVPRAEQHSRTHAQPDGRAEQAAQQAAAAMHEEELEERDHQEVLHGPQPSTSQRLQAQRSQQHHAQGSQAPPTIVLLQAGRQVEGVGGNTHLRNVYFTLEDHTGRMLDMRELVKAVGWAHLFVPKAGTRSMCSMLWTLIWQQAAREGPPDFLLSEAPKPQTIFSAVPKARYLLRLSQIRTLYWISDALERGLLDNFCKDVWAGTVYECSMQSIREYEAQGAGQKRAAPGRARGVKSLFASQNRRGKTSATPDALKAARVPMQPKATDAVGHSARASSQGKTGVQPDLACAQLPASMPSQDPASHADAQCAVTWQPLQVSAPEALEGAQRQGVKDIAQGQSCRPAAKAEGQRECIQAVACGVREPTQEGCTAGSASRQGLAAAEGVEAAEGAASAAEGVAAAEAVGAAGAQSGERSIVQAPEQEREGNPSQESAPTMSAAQPTTAPNSSAGAISPRSDGQNRQVGGFRLVGESTQLDTVIGEDGCSHPRTVFHMQDGRTMLDLREVARAVGIHISTKEGSRDVCRRLWAKARTRARELGKQSSTLARPCPVRRHLRTYYLLDVQHVQTLYLLATEAQRKGLNRFCKDVWPRQYETSMLEVERLHAGASEQARPTSAAVANVLPAALQPAEPEHESQPPRHLESMQLPSSSQRADPHAQERRGQQHTAPGHDACMQQQQHQQLPSSSQPVDSHAQARRGMQQTALGDDACMQQRRQQQLLQATLRIPGRAARAVAVIRGPEEAAVCMRQLHNIFADRLSSRQSFYQKVHMEGGQRSATAPERLFLRGVGAVGRYPTTVALLTLPAAVKALRRCGFTERELAAVAALQDGPALTAVQLGKLPAAGAEPGADTGQEVAEQDAAETLACLHPVPLSQPDCNTPGRQLKNHGSLHTRHGLISGAAHGASVGAAHVSPAVGPSERAALAPANAEACSSPGATPQHHGNAAATVRMKREKPHKPDKQQAAPGVAGDPTVTSEADKVGSTPGVKDKQPADAATSMSASAHTPGKQHAAVGAPSAAALTPEAAQTGIPAVTRKRHADAAAAVRVTRARAQRADQQQAVMTHSDNIAGASGDAKIGSTLAGTQRAGQQQALGGAPTDATAVQSAGAMPRIPKHPCISAPSLSMDSQQRQAHTQLHEAPPEQQAPKAEQPKEEPEQEPAGPEPPEFNPKKDLRIGCTVLIHTEEDESSTGWGKPWSVGTVVWLRKDKSQADVLWLQPEPREGIWGSKWVPVEVDAWTPKKSRTERFPWRSEHLDTACFVWGTKLQEDATFTPQEQLMMAKAANYVEDLADNPKS